MKVNLKEVLQEFTQHYMPAQKELYILCENKGKQESIRTNLLHRRKKLPAPLQNLVGVRTTTENGNFFVVIFPRKIAPLYVRENGKLTEVTP